MRQSRLLYARSSQAHLFAERLKPLGTSNQCFESIGRVMLEVTEHDHSVPAFLEHVCLEHIDGITQFNRTITYDVSWCSKGFRSLAIRLSHIITTPIRTRNNRQNLQLV